MSAGRGRRAQVRSICASLASEVVRVEAGRRRRADKSRAVQDAQIWLPSEPTTEQPQAAPIGGSGLSWNHGKSRAVRAMPSVSDAAVTVCDAPSGDLGRAGVGLALNGESGRLAAWHFQGQHISIRELGAGNAGN